MNEEKKNKLIMALILGMQLNDIEIRLDSETCKFIYDLILDEEDTEKPSYYVNIKEENTYENQ